MHAITNKSTVRTTLHSCHVPNLHDCQMCTTAKFHHEERGDAAEAARCAARTETDQSVVLLVAKDTIQTRPAARQRECHDSFPLASSCRLRDGPYVWALGGGSPIQRRSVGLRHMRRAGATDTPS